jgi:hypothetical protein
MDPASEWMRRAMSENLEQQRLMNSVTGSDRTQDANDGEDGKAKVEKEGYSWTQTGEEVELVVGVGALAKKELKVQFLGQSVKVNKGELLALELFARVDPDGCTWTLEKAKGGGSNLVITLEKSEEVSWPRILK